MMKREYKPYDLVLVTHEDYAHIGQTISYSTPEQTIMVRLVPDDPITMVELPLSLIKKADGKYNYVQYAEVSGSFAFPIDMLRYDFCAPVSFTLREDEYGRIKTELKTDFTKLIVGRACRYKAPVWTTARWASFSWTIKHLKTLKLIGSPS